MQNAKKLVALFSALLFALVLTSSILFVAVESEHNCTGNDCQICEQVSICLHIFDNTTPDPEVNTPAIFAGFAVVLCIGFEIVCKKLNTLVDLKVKLSD
ncbi:MAG: hypothetical protein IJS03_07810 [Eubacterium sp.]|nr:hypothetical protein [Eubacterium sp.]